MGVNVGQILRQGAVRHGAQAAVVEGGRATSYAALDERARVVAAALAAGGIAAGDRVLLCAGNHAGFVEGFFGIVYAGAVVVPAPILSPEEELRARVDRAGCRAALCDAAREEVVARATGRDGVGPDRERGAAVPAIRIDHLAGPPIDAPLDLDPGADAMILFTSGTTAGAKAARISHASLLLHTAALVHHALRLEADDRVFGAIPLTHSFGCRMAMLAPFFAGASVVLVERFDPEGSLRLLAEESITWAPVVPTMLAAWLRLPAGPKPPALRWVLSAGAPLPEEIAIRAEARLGVPVRQGYGLTEATFSTIDAPPAPRTPGSVGLPVWGVEVRIGESGEIEVRGQNVMSGYLGEAATRGWLRTGDIGRLDEAGRLFVIDRAKDLIIRGGNNVHPAEVEAVLCRHAGVAEAAVVGRPDPYYGEEVVAVVVPHEGADLDDLFRFAATYLSPAKLPRELAVVEALPLGPSGKVLKRVLREQIASGQLPIRRLGHR